MNYLLKVRFRSIGPQTPLTAAMLMLCGLTTMPTKYRVNLAKTELAARNALDRASRPTHDLTAANFSMMNSLLLSALTQSVVAAYPTMSCCRW